MNRQMDDRGERTAWKLNAFADIVGWGRHINQDIQRVMSSVIVDCVWWLYRCWRRRRRQARQCCEHVDRPTHDSTDRRWRQAVRRDSASTTALDLLVDTATRTHTHRSDTCTTDCSWDWTHRRLCTSYRRRHTASQLSLKHQTQPTHTRCCRCVTVFAETPRFS